MQLTRGARRTAPEDAFMAVLLALAGRMRQRLPGDELDWSLLPLLRRLDDSGPLRHTALADGLSLDVSTVSRKVRQLEDRGLVRVSPDPDDARARRVELLPAGRRAMHQLLAHRRDVIGRVLRDWPREDREVLHTLLDRFLHDLQETSSP